MKKILYYRVFTLLVGMTISFQFLNGEEGALAAHLVDEDLFGDSSPQEIRAIYNNAYQTIENYKNVFIKSLQEDFSYALTNTDGFSEDFKLLLSDKELYDALIAKVLNTLVKIKFLTQEDQDELFNKAQEAYIPFAQAYREQLAQE